MSSTDNIVQLASQTHGSDQAAAKAVLGNIAGMARKQLPPLLQSMLDRADTTLFEMSEKSENTTEQGHYFDSMRELRRLRAEIVSGFSRALEDGCTQVMVGDGGAATAKDNVRLASSTLSLVGESELEESLAIKVMADKIRNMEHQLLEAITQRLECLLVPRTGKPVKNPFSPEAICDYFQQSLTVLEADLSVRLIIYKLFDLNVLSMLGPFYEAVNNVMLQAGILPQLPKVISKSSNRTREQGGQARAEAGDAQGERRGEDGGDSAANLLNLLQELLRSPSSGGMVPIESGASFSDGRKIASIDARQLVQTLTQLQLTQSGGELIDGSQLRSLIASSLRAEGEDSVAGFQQRESIMIDVVAMLFSVILEDREIPDVAKALIGRLQIPMVKVALLDQSFLGKKAHPARQLLNRLAQICSGLDRFVDSESPELVEVRRIIGSIIDNFDSDLGVFERELEALEMFMALQGDEDDRVSSAISEAKTRHEQHERIRLHVDETINIKLSMSAAVEQMPEMIRSIISGPWRQTLLHTAQQHGTDSPVWQKRSDLIHHLIDSIQPKADAVARGQLLKQIPGLITGLRQGLQDAGFESEAITGVLKVLEPLHMAILVPDKSRAAKTESEAQARSDAMISEMEADMAEISNMLADMTGSLLEEGESEHRIPDEWMDEIVLGSDSEEPSMMVDDEYVVAVRAMELGQMVILRDKDDNPVRGKLAWKSDYLGEYVFTNWRHKVVAERTINGLAVDLYLGKVELLATTPILERAMETVFTTLRLQRTTQTDVLVAVNNDQ